MQRCWTGFIIIFSIMTSVFNTDASLPYNHDLFESLIVKKRVKVDGEGLGWKCNCITIFTEHFAIHVPTLNREGQKTVFVRIPINQPGSPRYTNRHTTAKSNLFVTMFHVYAFVESFGAIWLTKLIVQLHS
ncbi:hypothetical protein T265_15756, partial [Opisthorchis viverrini]